MFLQRLKEYADRHPPELPSMYAKTPIKWLIDLDRDGRLLGFVPTVGEAGKKKDRGMEYAAPDLKRAYGIKPKLLADNGEYVLGLPRAPGKLDRVLACHEAFKQAVADCAEATGVAEVQSALRFLSTWDARNGAGLPPDATGDDTFTFRVDGAMPILDPRIQSHWASLTGEDTGTGRSPMPCIVCGQLRVPVVRLPVAIKGTSIPNGQTAGMAIISANEKAYESYGLEASLVAPICHGCAESTHRALNSLLASRTTSLRVGDVSYVAWTREETPFSFLTLLADPTAETVTALLRSVFTGGSTANPNAVEADRFYAAALSASGARIVIRSWLDTTVETAGQRLARYFEGQRIINHQGQVDQPMTLYALAASTVRDARKSPPHPRLISELLAVALEGASLSPWVLAQVVQRNRAEQRVTHPRAALIKLYFAFRPQPGLQEGNLMQLNEQNSHPAYLCGRLLAVLEAVQDSAVPGANTTLVDRFFGTASSAPGVVFGSLLRHAQAHLAKLRKQKRGLYQLLQTELEEIQAGLPAFPKTLTLEEQGLFSLGYYHQRAARWKPRTAERDSETAASVQEG